MTHRLLIPTRLDARALAASRIDADVRRLSGATMGTGWSLSFAAPSSVTNQDVVSALDACFASIIAQMSGWEPASELCAYNRAPPGWRMLSPDFITVLSRALEIASATDGAFNPALAHETDALGFGPGIQLDGKAQRGDWRGIRIDAVVGRVLQPGGVALDLSSIAKGYALDACARSLAALGAPSFLMEIGGEFAGRGLQPNGQPWRVELELSDLPVAAGEPARTLVALPGASLATSGDFVRRNVLGAHLLDGRTRMPVDGSLSGVAVIAETCMDADGWATALFALGERDGMSMAATRGIAAVFMRRTEQGARAALSPAAVEMLD